jgi:hypothetical protein
MAKMDLAEWVSAFRALHEKAKRDALSSVEDQDYRAQRESLAKAFVAAQRLTRQPDQAPREALRVALVLQVDLESRVRMERLATSELSLGGFSARMARAPAPDEELSVTLRLPGAEPVGTRVKVVGVKAQPGFVLVSFSFIKLDGAAAERLEIAVFDHVLAQISI